MTTKPPTLALSSFWFLYMGAMGLFFPFYALYLREDAALRGGQVGLVMAMIPLVGLAAPTLWGRLADRSGARGRVLAAAVVGGAFGLGALGLLRGFVPLLLGTALAAGFLSAILPLGVSVSLAALGAHGGERFGRVRVWGTVGYLALVVGYPLARSFSGSTSLSSMFPIAALLTLAAAATVRALPEKPLPESEHASNWRSLFRHPPFVRILLFSFFAYLCLQGPMSLFPMYVRAQGGGVEELSVMWAIMLLPEIPLVAFSGAGLRRFGARALLGVGVLAGAARWIVCGWVDDLAWIYASQALHGVLVAGLLVGAPLYLDAAVPERLRATAQGLLSMAGIGVGGIVSSVATGWLHDGVGADAPYQIGGIGALVLALSITWILPAPTKP